MSERIQRAGTAPADVAVSDAVSTGRSVQSPRIEPLDGLDPRKEDRALIGAIASGDRAAFGKLYDRHASRALRVAMAIVGSRAAAEDVVHDVFLEIWKRAHTYDAKRASVSSWILLRVRSRSLDRVRSAAVSRRSPLSDAPERAECPDPGAGLDAERLQQHLAMLSEEQREVIVLGYFGGMSCTEMAQRLLIPVGTVKSRVATGMRNLRETFHKGGR